MTYEIRYYDYFPIAPGKPKRLFQIDASAYPLGDKRCVIFDADVKPLDFRCTLDTTDLEVISKSLIGTAKNLSQLYQVAKVYDFETLNTL